MGFLFLWRWECVKNAQINGRLAILWLHHDRKFGSVVFSFAKIWNGKPSTSFSMHPLDILLRSVLLLAHFNKNATPNCVIARETDENEPNGTQTENALVKNVLSLMHCRAIQIIITTTARAQQSNSKRTKRRKMIIIKFKRLNDERSLTFVSCLFTPQTWRIVQIKSKRARKEKEENGRW